MYLTDNQMLLYAMKRFADIKLQYHYILRIEYRENKEPYTRYAKGIIPPDILR